MNRKEEKAMRLLTGNAREWVITTLLSMSLLAGTVLAGESAPAKESSAGEDTSGYIRDYLSDPRRTGSLAGSILGGALTANPAGTIIGSVIGFFVGKNSMYNEDKARAAQATAKYAKREIVPLDAQVQGAPTLSFADPKGIAFAATPSGNAAAAPLQAMTSPKSVPDTMAMSRDQIAKQCGGKGLGDPRLRSLCFYYQGS
jgi:hypothetical protein